MSGSRDLDVAHRRSSMRRDEIGTYPPSEVRGWIDGGRSALCRMRPVNAVIEGASDFPVNLTFLQAMQERWL